MRVNNKNTKSLSLKSNSLWNVFGSLVYSLTQWGLVIAIAKNGSPEMVGIFTLSLALTAPVVLLTRLNLRVAVASDINNEFGFNEYYTSRIIATIVSLLILIIITIFYPTDTYTRVVIFIMCFAKAFESVSDILYGQLQKHERLDIIAKSRIIKGLVSFIAFTIIMMITNDLLLSTIGLLIIWLLTLIIYDFKVIREIFGEVSINFRKKHQLLILKLTIPLGIAQLIASLNSNVPRYVIEHYHGIEMLGFYSAIIYIIVAGSNVVLAISSAVLPRLSTLYQNSKIKEFLKIILNMIFMVLILGIIALLIVYTLGGEILEKVYSTEYKYLNKEFFLFTVMGIFKYTNVFLDTGISATRKFVIQPYINGITLSIISVLSFILIPLYGMNGAIYSLIIAEIVQLILRGVFISYLLIKRTKNPENY
ncbi:oligosaccharide flippase family protein [Sporosarcina luteola]|uniref:lipopolysaccharide biosynthesis protein n=1 Tax=Sporosarcina luteola TaxID=582850 RepID=UPI00203AF744|nr:oligosaccharide flippase family protein [Sporosarcina luteola]MCM3744096.1 oligosaccharide flippase family protein [Sporosarcina luteola]